MSNNKEINFKEKLKQALTSTARVISDDLEKEKNNNQNKSSNKFDFFEIDNLNSKSDFIKARAESDSTALKKKFSDELIYKKNLPSNSSCKSLYAVTEKIRYEALGGKMLKGIKKNFKENYSQIINLKRKDQIKSREDVTINEAFELYMLKNFHNVELNDLCSKILSFWENDFDQSISKHIKFLKENLENQNIYSSRFSEILQEMEIFQTEDEDQASNENQENNQNNPPDNNDENQEQNEKEQSTEEETNASLDSDYDIDEYKLDEQLVDTDSEKQSSEQVIQKKNLNDLNHEYKIFSTYFDEIIKAENLEKEEEINLSN